MIDFSIFTDDVLDIVIDFLLFSIKQYNLDSLNSSHLSVFWLLQKAVDEREIRRWNHSGM